MNQLTETELGYIAGLIDGEGTIGLYPIGKKYRTIRPYVGISNSSEKLIDWILKITGIGLKTGFKPRTQQHLYSFRWMIYTKKDTEDFLKIILSYLIIKKDKAILVLEYLESRKNRPKHKSPYTEKELEIFSQFGHHGGRLYA